MENSLLIGETLGRFGSGIEVLVQLKPNFVQQFKKLDFVMIPALGILTPFFIMSIKPKNSNTFIVQFDDVNTIQQAQLLEKLPVIAPVHLVSPPSAVGFHLDDLEGFTVSDTELGELGVITGISNFPGQQLFEIRLPNGNELLVPAIKDFIIAIEREEKRIILKTPDGLVALYT